MSGAILGVGTDLVDVARVERALARHGTRFRDKVFTPAEQAYCESMKAPGKYYAARFAAKEAVSKAFGTGLGKDLGWQSISVEHHSTGAPKVILDAPARALLDKLGGGEVLISLTHTETLAQAFAVITRSAHV